MRAFGHRWLQGTEHVHDGREPEFEYPLSTDILAMTRVYASADPSTPRYKRLNHCCAPSWAIAARAIGDMIFGKVMHLVPFLQRLDVDGPDLGVAEGLEMLNQMAADKTTSSCDND